jgi:hypothetical protein
MCNGTDSVFSFRSDRRKQEHRKKLGEWRGREVRALGI